MNSLKYKLPRWLKIQLWLMIQKQHGLNLIKNKVFHIKRFVVDLDWDSDKHFELSQYCPKFNNVLFKDKNLTHLEYITKHNVKQPSQLEKIKNYILKDAIIKMVKDIPHKHKKAVEKLKSDKRKSKIQWFWKISVSLWPMHKSNQIKIAWNKLRSISNRYLFKNVSERKWFYTFITIQT